MAGEFQGSLTWLGHSTFLLGTPGGKRILLDAFIESCPTCPDEFKGDGVGDLDAILVTHGHGDHLAEAIGQAKRTGAPVAGMVELVGWFTSNGLPEDQGIAFNKG